MGNFISSYFQGNVQPEVDYLQLDQYSKEQVVEYIKRMKPHNMQITPEYAEIFKKINFESSDMIVMCIELYEKLAKQVPAFTPQKQKKKSFTKKVYADPQFTSQQYIQYVNENAPTLGTVEFDIEEQIKPKTELNIKKIGVVEFIDAFRDANFKMDIIGINRHIMSDMSELQKQRFLNVFNDMFVNGNSPNRIAFGKASYIYKKGDVDKVNSFRTVITLPLLVNHFHRILAIRLSEYLLKNNYIDTDIQKGGFGGKKLPLLQQIYKVKSVIRNANKKNKKLAIMFLDISNAYGTLSLPALYTIMRKYHIEEQFINYLKSFYDNFQYYAKTKDWSSDLIRWENGLITGCSMAPILFVMALNYVLVHIEGKMKISHGYQFSNFNYILFTAFIDDICIMAKDLNALNEVYQCLKQMLSLLNLSVNTNKTQIMLINEEKNDTVLTEFQYVDHYKYLGEQICQDGTSTMAYKTFLGTLGRQLYRIEKRTDINNVEKVAFFNSIVLPYIHRRTASMYDLSNNQRIFIAKLVKEYMIKWNSTEDIKLFSTHINTILESDDKVIQNLDHEEYDNIEDEIEIVDLKFSNNEFNYGYNEVKEDVAMENDDKN